MPGLKPETESTRPHASKSAVAAQQNANTSTSENPESKVLIYFLIHLLKENKISKYVNLVVYFGEYCRFNFPFHFCYYKISVYVTSKLL